MGLHASSDGVAGWVCCQVLAVAAVALRGEEANGDAGPPSRGAGGIIALAGSVHAVNRVSA